MLYVPHIRRSPTQELLRRPLHPPRNAQRQRHPNVDRVIANQVQRHENDQKGPEKYKARNEPPRILDTWYGKLLGCSVPVVASLGQRSMPLAHCIHFLSSHSWCFAVVVLGKAVGAVLEEFLYRALRTLYQGPVQGCEALVICRIDICAPA